MIACECCDIKLKGSMVVTLWGLFCSQSCADAYRDSEQMFNDRDFEWRNDPNY